MASIEKLVRDSLAAWVAGLAWQVTPTIVSEEPKPGDKPTLPTLAVYQTSERIDNATARAITPEVTRLGWADAEVVFIFRAGSADDAERYREDWRNVAWKAALDASSSGTAPVLPLTFRVGDETMLGKLYLTGETELATPEDTQMRGLWQMRCVARLVYPALAVHGPDALMSVSLELDGAVYDAADFKVPRVVRSAPVLLDLIETRGELSEGAAARWLAGEALFADDPVILVFDQPMQSIGLDADDYAVTIDGVLVEIRPRSGDWPAGPNTVALGRSRSRRGTVLESYTLTFEVV